MFKHISAVFVSVKLTYNTAYVDALQILVACMPQYN
jgi:hypothetical protein